MIAILGNIDLVNAEEQQSISTKDICLAAISNAMLLKPSELHAYSQKENVIYIASKKYKYKCKVEGNRVIYSSDQGRWRTHPDDEIILFRSSGSSLTIEEHYGDGSISKGNFVIKNRKVIKQ